jgi:hypothetical protein
VIEQSRNSGDVDERRKMEAQQLIKNIRDDEEARN